jgi:hypothetical protein
LSFVCASAALAQDITGTITGTILDTSGAGVPGAKVTSTSLDRNQVVRSTTTYCVGN